MPAPPCQHRHATHIRMRACVPALLRRAGQAQVTVDVTPNGRGDAATAVGRWAGRGARAEGDDGAWCPL